MMRLSHIFVPAVAVALIGCSENTVSPPESSHEELPLLRSVRFALILPSGKEIAEITSIEGDEPTITVNNEIYGIIPQIQDRESGIVNFRLYKMMENEDGTRSSNFLEDLEVKAGASPVIAETVPYFNFKVKSILDPQDEWGFPEPLVPGQCCVTCQEGNWWFTSCGCRVIMSCGSCCVEDCCPQS